MADIEHWIILISPSLPISNRMRKKQQNKTSYERAKEAFEAAREKRRIKKEVMSFFLKTTTKDYYQEQSVKCPAC